GESRVQGVDFTLVYDSKNLVSMLTYTLSKAENRFPEIFSNQYFPSSDDSRHQLKFFNAYSFKKVEFTLTYSGATGRPYLDLSNLDRMIDRRNLNLNKYIQKLSDYHRIDLSASYKMNFKHWYTQIGFTVFNLFDRVNVKYRQFIYQLPPGQGSNSQQNTIVGSDISQLERTYNLTFSFGWR
nr:TonB-dependent receptor [Saprospiraceae bacterium]